MKADAEIGREVVYAMVNGAVVTTVKTMRSAPAPIGSDKGSDQ